jgi:hypothetical protein
VNFADFWDLFFARVASLSLDLPRLEGQATTKAKTTAKAKAKTNTGILRFAQNDDLESIAQDIKTGSE